MAHAAPPAAGRSLIGRALTLEPAVVKGVVGALVALGLIWGIDLSAWGDRIDQTADIVLGTLLPLVTAWWIRSSVTPDAKVAVVVQPDGTVEAGPASPLPTGTVIDENTVGPVV